MACVEGGRSDMDVAGGRGAGQVPNSRGAGPGALGTRENKRCPGRKTHVNVGAAGWEGAGLL